MKRRLCITAAALSAAIALGGCVGPAGTTQVYEGKAVRTANDSLSALQTALLTVATSRRGRVTQAYLETVLSNAEDTFSSVQNTFDSIQPPNTARAAALRDGLDKLLSDGADGMAQLRILARQRDRSNLYAEAQMLASTATGLDQFAQGHG
jgi:hypothetical protein